jgi:hypothetical protein
MMTQFDKDLAELVAWLREKNMRVRIPMRGPIRFERLPSEMAPAVTTENWHANQGGFWGTSNQLIRCARCGVGGGGYNEPRKFCDVCKPSMHWICNECFDQLPDE